jgi:hypothetical protein
MLFSSSSDLIFSAIPALSAPPEGGSAAMPWCKPKVAAMASAEIGLFILFFRVHLLLSRAPAAQQLMYNRLFVYGKMNTNEALRRFAQVVQHEHLALATARHYCAWLRRYCDDLTQFALHLSPRSRPQNPKSSP